MRGKDQFQQTELACVREWLRRGRKLAVRYRESYGWSGRSAANLISIIAQAVGEGRDPARRQLVMKHSDGPERGISRGISREINPSHQATGATHGWPALS
jgi:hypothetical protein